MPNAIKSGVRLLVRRVGFTARTVAIAALGISATTTMVALARPVLWRQLPFLDASRLVLVHAVRPDQRIQAAYAATWDRAPIGWASWEDLAEAPVFADVGVWMPSQQILGSDRGEVASVFYVSSSFLRVLGVRPALGRGFTTDENSVVTDVAIISYERWQRDFAGRPDVVGQTLAVAYSHSSQTIAKRVVGVLPPDFRFQGEAPSVLLPIGLMAWNGSFEANRFLRAVARLAPGVSLEQAAAVAEPLVRRDESAEHRTARLVTLNDDRLGGLGKSFWILLTGAGLLMTVAGSTLASLLLVDGFDRRSELAVRAALGASRRTLCAQLLSEYAVIAFAGSCVGVLLATGLIPIVAAIVPGSEQTLEGASLTFAAAGSALSLGTGAFLLFGLGPAAVASAWACPGAAGRADRSRGTRAIVAAQVAAAVVLSTTAGLFTQTSLALVATPLGFESDRLGVAAVKLKWTPVVFPLRTEYDGSGPPGGGRAALEAGWNSGWVHTQGVLEMLANLPSVVEAAGTSTAPFTRATRVTTVRDAEDQAPPHEWQWQVVTEDYFRVMGIPILRGRSLQSTDRRGAVVGVVVSSSAEAGFADQSALGKEVDWSGQPLKIVGIAGDVQQHRPWTGRPQLPAMYILDQRANQIGHFVVRTTGDVPSLLPAIKDAIENYDGSLSVTSAAAMSDLVAESLAEERFLATLATAFGIQCLLLMAMGLFALSNYQIGTRRAEFALRTALGASPFNIRMLVLRDGMAVVVAGLAVGIPSALGALQVIDSKLSFVEAMPATVWATSVVATLVTTLIALGVPVLRGGHVRPAALLR